MEKPSHAPAQLAERFGLPTSAFASEAAQRPRGHVVQREGEPCDRAYLLVKGTARAYALDPDGGEHVTWFAFEGDLLASVEALTGAPARDTVELTEPSALVAIDVAALRPRLGTDPAATALALALVTEHAQALDDEVRALRALSAAERYALLLDREPDLLQRVRLQDVASYLGVARETLSRIRGEHARSGRL